MFLSPDTPGQVLNAQPPGKPPADPRDTVEGDEAIRKRGLFLSVMQAVALVVGFALLFVVVAESVFVSALSIGAVLAILGCLHYWTWGRRMSRALRAKGRRTPAAR
jgi:Flp pilus assembly protein TadB